MSEFHSDHSHIPARNVLAAAGITLVAGSIEIVGAWKGRSLFLMADAIHLLAHLAIFGILLIPQGRWHRRGEDVTTLGVLGVVLLIAFGVVAASIRDFRSPAHESPQALYMLLALGGLSANLTSAYLFRKSARERWSFRAALAHELSDGALTVAGLLGVPAIQYFGWTWVDPGLSFLIGAWLFVWAGRLLAKRLRGGPEAWTRETEPLP